MSPLVLSDDAFGNKCVLISGRKAGQLFGVSLSQA
jgi:hypothetical protein